MAGCASTRAHWRRREADSAGQSSADAATGRARGESCRCILGAAEIVEGMADVAQERGRRQRRASLRSRLAGREFILPVHRKLNMQ